MKARLWCVDYEAREPGALGVFGSRRVFVQASTKEEAGKKALARLHKTTRAELRAPRDIIPIEDFKKWGIKHWSQK
tara:strand:+ start:115 stop:342 length:228 start_codon:yes stop_codon:yes gene_type:complete